MTMVTVDPLHDPRWSELVRTDGSVFHHPAWIGLLHDQYGFPMTACCVAGADGRLVAGLPIARVRRGLVALPFSDLCPPIGAGDAAADLRRGLEAMRGADPLEVHGGGPALADAAPGDRFHHHVIDLDGGPAAAERRAKPAIRRGTRRALREGLTAEVRTDAAALAEFYRLHTATRARLGVPTQPRRFILRFATPFAAGLGFVMVVRHRERPIAASLFLTHRDVLTYKYGASDARLLGMRPNNLLFTEAIRWGCEHGMRALDLGRTDWGHESLRAFKLAWGARESELRYRRLGGEAPHKRGWTSGRTLHAALRHSPPIASRIVGEVLYRRAA